MALMSVLDAQTKILSSAARLGVEQVNVEDAFGRILACDLAAELTQPPFNASAMDGYAVRADDVARVPARLCVIGESAAGKPFNGELAPGSAVRIFTGAPVPSGADAIVIQENTRPLEDGHVEILETSAKGRHIRGRGIDFAEGEVLLAAGLRLQSRHLMLAAAMNHAQIKAAKKPRVALIATGDELKAPGSTLAEGEIISSIPAGLKAALETWGAEATILGIARDAVGSLTALVEQGADFDVLVTIGGASVGDHDIVRPVLEGLGATFEVLKVAMRPGKPIMFGFRGAQRIVGLPGNPVSAFVCAQIFLKPLLLALQGSPALDPGLEMPLGEEVGANSDREHYLRARYVNGKVVPLADQDSSLVSRYAEADCLIKRDPYGPALQADQKVIIFPLS